MMSLKNQRGASFVFWVLILALIGFLITIGIKLFPVYYRGFAVKKVVEDIAHEMQGKDPNKNQLWELVDKRLYINQVSDVKRENMVYEKNKNSIEFGVDYEVRKPLVANVDAVVKFDHRQTINSK